MIVNTTIKYGKTNYQEPIIKFVIAYNLRRQRIYSFGRHKCIYRKCDCVPIIVHYFYAAAVKGREPEKKIAVFMASIEEIETFLLLSFTLKCHSFM